jgi:hypothetical protein
MNAHSDKGGGQDNQFQVTVSYNGISKPLDVNSHQQVQAVFARAMELFHNPGGDLALFIGANPVAVHQSVVEAGIVAGTILLLRPRNVGGG